ncbi:MAG: hypothetical protein ACP5U0_08880 [Caldisphaera sp.]
MNCEDIEMVVNGIIHTNSSTLKILININSKINISETDLKKSKPLNLMMMGVMKIKAKNK